MKPDQLLKQLESLTHDARMRRMVELGRIAASDRSIAATLDTLESGGFYDRFLALQSCYGSGDAARALRALNDPSRAIRTLAIALLPLIGDDRQVQSALETLPFKQRRLLIQWLLKRHRNALIDGFLDRITVSNPEQFARLLPFGSSEIVARHLETIADRAGFDDWLRLARLHPNLTTEVLLRQAQEATNLDRRLVWRVNTVLPVLAELYPERAIALVRAIAPHVSLAQLNLQQLAERRPADIVDLILHSDDKARVRLDKVAHKLDSDRLLALLDRHSDTVSMPSIWFKNLVPEQRAIIYNAAVRYWCDRDGILDANLVALLPGSLREREGRHYLALPALATRPIQRLPYAAFLAWEDCRTVLDSFIRNPDADLRSAALSALILAIRYNRDRLAEILAIARARRNEQDPVRCTIITGLANLPPSLWRTEHLDDISEIITDALNAADLSFATGNAAERLIIALLPFHPNWAAQWLAKLVKKRGQISFYNLGDRLSDRDAIRIAPILLPVLQSWETRECEGQLIEAARSFGRRLRVFDALIDILERVIKNTWNSWIALSALDLIAKHRSDRFAKLIPELIKKDPSWATQSVVYNSLHRRRQDLLTPFLGQKSYKGRFSTGSTRFVLPIVTGFQRWTPTQQAIFAKTLEEVTRDRDRAIPALLFTIQQLQALPAVEPKRLIEMASALNPQLAVRDAALRSLSRLDAAFGLPTLIEALNDDRARIAIYALRRILLEIPANNALQLLRDVSLEKVTVAKEVVRLLGDLSSPEAYRQLREINQRELHRDVRVAVLRSLWNYLESEETWPILESAAVSPDTAIAAIVARIPTDKLSPISERRFTSLLASLLTHPDPVVRLDVLRRCKQLPVADSERILLQKLLDAMNSLLPDESTAAARAIFATYSKDAAHWVGEAIARIVSNRRSLQIAMQTLQEELRASRGQLLPTARAVLSALASDSLTVNLRVEVAAIALPWQELTQLLKQLVSSGEMHAEALIFAVKAIENAASRSDAVELRELEATFENDSDDRLRRLALAALVAQSKPPRGWNSERLARLLVYRNDRSPLVAATAQFIFPPESV